MKRHQLAVAAVDYSGGEDLKMIASAFAEVSGGDDCMRDLGTYESGRGSAHVIRTNGCDETTPLHA